MLGAKRVRVVERRFNLMESLRKMSLICDSNPILTSIFYPLLVVILKGYESLAALVHGVQKGCIICALYIQNRLALLSLNRPNQIPFLSARRKIESTLGLFLCPPFPLNSI